MKTSTASAPEHRVTVVSVAYNSTAVLPRLLSSLPRCVDLVIVDNASDDHDALVDLVKVRKARLIRNADNQGFGTACNIGAKHVRTEFVLFLNPDAQLGHGALDALVSAADVYPGASAFNPAITDARGRPYFKRGSVLLPASARMPSGWPDNDCEVPILTGAALFVRRAAFEAVGGFDPAIFMYHEDDDLALRLRAQCGSLMFIRRACVMHDTGNSTVRSPQSAAFKAFHMGQSRVYATRKHGVKSAVRKALFSALAQLVSPLTLLSARKRAKQTAFLRGVLTALRQKPAG